MIVHMAVLAAAVLALPAGIGPNRVAHRHWYPLTGQYKWLGVRCAR